MKYLICVLQENKYNEINVKYIRIRAYEYTKRIFVSNLPHRDRKPEYISKSSSSKQNMAVMASDGSSPHSPSLRLGRPVPSHRNANTPSPCWAPHFMAQERIMFSNPTPSKPHFSPAVTMSDDTLSALTPRLRPCTALLSCNLQPLLRCRC